MHLILFFISILLINISHSIIHSASLHEPRRVLKGFESSKIPFRDPRISRNQNHHDRLSSTPRSLLTSELQSRFDSSDSDSTSFERMSQYSSSSSSDNSRQESHGPSSLIKEIIDPDELRSIFRSRPTESQLERAAHNFKNGGENPITLIEMKNWEISIRPPLIPNHARTNYFYDIKDVVNAYESQIPFTPKDLAEHLNIIQDRPWSLSQWTEFERKLLRFSPFSQSGDRFTLSDYEDLINELMKKKPNAIERIQDLLDTHVIPQLMA